MLFKAYHVSQGILTNLPLEMVSYQGVTIKYIRASGQWSSPGGASVMILQLNIKDTWLDSLLFEVAIA